MPQKAILQRKNIIDILNGPDGTRELDNFISDHKMNYDSGSALFIKASTDLWIKTITGSNAADIDQFRYTLTVLYPTSSIRSLTCFDDLPFLKEISEALFPDNSEDLILQNNME